MAKKKAKKKNNTAIERIENVKRSLKTELEHYKLINPIIADKEGSLRGRQNRCDLFYVKIHAIAVQIRKEGVKNIVNYMLKEHAEQCTYDIITIMQVVIQTAFKVIKQGLSDSQKMKKAKEKR